MYEVKKAAIYGAFNAVFSSERYSQESNIIVEPMDLRKPIILAVVCFWDGKMTPAFYKLDSHLSATNNGMKEPESLHPTPECPITTEFTELNKHTHRFMLRIEGKWYTSGKARAGQYQLRDPDIICAYIGNAVNGKYVVSAAQEFQEEQSELHHLRQECTYLEPELEQTQRKLEETNSLLNRAALTLNDISLVANRPWWTKENRIHAIRQYVIDYFNDLEKDRSCK